MAATPTVWSGQFGRFGQLVVSNATQGLDLSNLRVVSGALALASECPEFPDPHPALRAADAHWHERFKAITTGEVQLEDSNGNGNR